MRFTVVLDGRDGMTAALSARPVLAVSLSPRAAMAVVMVKKTSDKVMRTQDGIEMESQDGDVFTIQ